MSGWTVVLSEEVEAWYRKLNVKDRAIADRHLAALEELGDTLKMPRSKYLKGKLYELRFSCENVERRITYTIEHRRQIVTLTTFRKQRQNERKEIERARVWLARRRRKS